MEEQQLAMAHVVHWHGHSVLGTQVLVMFNTDEDIHRIRNLRMSKTHAYAQAAELRVGRLFGEGKLPSKLLLSREQER